MKRKQIIVVSIVLASFLIGTFMVPDVVFGVKRGNPMYKILEAIYKLQDRVNDLENKIDSQTISYNASWSNIKVDGYDNTSWNTIPKMKVRLTLNRTSFVRITMSAKMRFDGKGYVRALVDSNVAYPGEIEVYNWWSAYEGDYRSIDFYLPNVPAGFHNIEIQWRVYQPTHIKIDAWERTLFVTAF